MAAGTAESSHLGLQQVGREHTGMKGAFDTSSSPQWWISPNKSTLPNHSQTLPTGEQVSNIRAYWEPLLLRPPQFPSVSWQSRKALLRWAQPNRVILVPILAYSPFEVLSRNIDCTNILKCSPWVLFWLQYYASSMGLLRFPWLFEAFCVLLWTWGCFLRLQSYSWS